MQLNSIVPLHQNFIAVATNIFAVKMLLDVSLFKYICYHTYFYSKILNGRKADSVAPFIYLTESVYQHLKILENNEFLINQNLVNQTKPVQLFFTTKIIYYVFFSMPGKIQFSYCKYPYMSVELKL